MMKRRVVAALGLIGAVAFAAGDADAQRRPGGRNNFGFGSGGYGGPGLEFNVPYSGRFTFARIRYEGFYKDGREGPGWSHDYPIFETNFLNILNEITLMKPLMEGSNILDPSDPELFKYPVAYLSEPGGWYPSQTDVESLRAYLQKGGFLIVDDWNGNEYENGVIQLRRVLPNSELVQLDVKHAVFDSFFRIESLDISAQQAVFFGIFEDNDPKKRLMAVLNYNNDLGELIQFSGQGFNPFAESEAYKLIVNYIVYAMTR